MKLLRIALLVCILVTSNSCINSKINAEQANSIIAFNEDASKFSASEKQLIQEVVLESEREIRTLLPSLPDSINISLEIVDWDLNPVGGVTGRTETNSPPRVFIQISENYPGGVPAATQKALKHTIFHEFHHLYRGWAIQDNKFEPGIPIAAINEGLAVVFSEEYTSIVHQKMKLLKLGQRKYWSYLRIPTIKLGCSSIQMVANPSGKIW